MEERLRELELENRNLHIENELLKKKIQHRDTMIETLQESVETTQKEYLDIIAEARQYQHAYLNVVGEIKELKKRYEEEMREQISKIKG